MSAKESAHGPCTLDLFCRHAFGLRLNDELWTILTFVFGLALRLLVIRFEWEMPKFVFEDKR